MGSQGTPAFIRSKHMQANNDTSWKLQMETRMDEVWAEVKNTASNIAELLAFVKRSAEVCGYRGPSEPTSGQDMLEKTVQDGKFSPLPAMFGWNISLSANPQLRINVITEHACFVHGLDLPLQRRP